MMPNLGPLRLEAQSTMVQGSSFSRRYRRALEFADPLVTARTCCCESSKQDGGFLAFFGQMRDKHRLGHRLCRITRQQRKVHARRQYLCHVFVDFCQIRCVTQSGGQSEGGHCHRHQEVGRGVVKLTNDA